MPDNRHAFVNPSANHERALLVGIVGPGLSAVTALEYLDELALLAQTAGAEVVGRELSKRPRPDPATLVGKGKVRELAEIIAETGADLVIFDDDLAPAQVRNLEQGLERRVIDRTGLILDIFARRAQTREARTQVELAQLRYLLPRLTRAWTHLERQRGGIGMRGPGETQIETDRRIIRRRISILEQELQHIARVHATQRTGRADTYRFALAGYTNAGKSTLMNALTEAGVYEENLLFATLDSTTRALKLAPKRKSLLTDTVGFIRKLPPHLIASFRTTLAEIREAHCIVHVMDIAAASWREQMAEVNRILGELSVLDRPQILAFNKIDLLEDDAPRRMAAAEFPEAVFISARRGDGLDHLLERMRNAMSSEMLELTISVDPANGALLAELHRVAEILTMNSNGNHLELSVRIPEAHARRLGIWA